MKKNKGVELHRNRPTFYFEKTLRSIGARKNKERKEKERGRGGKQQQQQRHFSTWNFVALDNHDDLLWNCSLFTHGIR
jgi:hypothetical protein